MVFGFVDHVLDNLPPYRSKLLASAKQGSNLGACSLRRMTGFGVPRGPSGSRPSAGIHLARPAPSPSARCPKGHGPASRSREANGRCGVEPLRSMGRAGRSGSGPERRPYTQRWGTLESVRCRKSVITVRTQGRSAYPRPSSSGAALGIGATWSSRHQSPNLPTLRRCS